MIAWSARELPGATRAIETLLGYALKLGGIGSVDQLKARKIKHLSVYGQVDCYPQAYRADVERVQVRSRTIAAGLDEVVVPDGKGIPGGPDWEYSEWTAMEVNLGDLRYDAPL